SHDTLRTVFWDSGKNRVLDFLIGVDSLRESISIGEINSLYGKELARNGIHTKFNVTSFPGDPKQEIFPPEDNKVSVGFKKPVIYELTFQNPAFHILKKLAPQIIFSILVIGITLLSFFFLFRNWQQQKRLTNLKNDFIGNITHELKTPIATVSVAIEALKNFNALHDPERTREYLDISSNELQRLSLLVDKVLKLSMFEKEQIELRNENFDMEELIREVLASMRLQFEKFQAKVNIQTSGNDFYITADKLHITSVVYNLLDNALKYSKANPSIQIRLEEEASQLRIIITDNGVGIPSEYKDKVFEKFFRVPTGDKHNVKGYGLGLSYVSYVLQRQGGSISVESSEGIGSSFIILIPKQHESA
ncbi:MAG TPA: HAMP domain-containing sensor histidine kinase, partial [Puia sp.]|nr:HAMP domain-containing sensor histidine kinase [Puia sp.]